MSHFKGPDFHGVSNTSVLNQLLEHLSSHGDAVAMIEGDTGKRESFAGFLQRSQCIAAGLQSAGVTAGDYVVLCCDKSILAYSLFLGGILTGATVVIVPTSYAGRIDILTKDHFVKAVFCDVIYLDNVTQSVSRMTAPPVLTATTDLEDKVMVSMVKSKEHFSLYQVQNSKKHVSLILFTSGSTGDPKGVEITTLLLDSYRSTATSDFKNVMIAPPFSWTSAISFFICSIIYGYCLIISNPNDAKQHLQIIERYQVDMWFVSTGFMSKYINEPCLPEFDLSSVKTVYTGGDTLVQSKAESFSNKVLSGRVILENLFGSSELGSIARTKPNDLPSDNRYLLPTRLTPGVEVKIVDDGGNLVDIGRIGQICVKKANIMKGYWGRPVLYSKLFDENGFYLTGDAGCFDKHGRLYTAGRLCDIIDIRGLKFSPFELEDILVTHPAVKEAAVIAVKETNSSLNNLVTAFVVKTENIKVTESDLLSFVEGQVEDYKKLTGGVLLKDELPRTLTGKVDRKLLLQELIEHQ